MATREAQLRERGIEVLEPRHFLSLDDPVDLEGRGRLEDFSDLVVKDGHTEEIRDAFTRAGVRSNPVLVRTFAAIKAMREGVEFPGGGTPGTGRPIAARKQTFRRGLSGSSLQKWWGKDVVECTFSGQRGSTIFGKVKNVRFIDCVWEENRIEDKHDSHGAHVCFPMNGWLEDANTWWIRPRFRRNTANTCLETKGPGHYLYGLEREDSTIRGEDWRCRHGLFCALHGGKGVKKVTLRDFGHYVDAAPACQVDVMAGSALSRMVSKPHAGGNQERMERAYVGNGVAAAFVGRQMTRVRYDALNNVVHPDVKRVIKGRQSGLTHGTLEDWQKAVLADLQRKPAPPIKR